jgi:hypothetical protein
MDEEVERRLELVSEKIAASMLGLSVWTLRKDRHDGGLGIPYVKLGAGKRGLVRYDLADLERWIEAKKQTGRAPAPQALPPVAEPPVVEEADVQPELPVEPEIAAEPEPPNHNDLTRKTHAPLATDVPSSYMFRGRGTQHVIYRGFSPDGSVTNGWINELWWDGDWNYNDLIASVDDATSLADGLSPFGYEFSFDTPRGSFISQSVVYKALDDGNIHLLFWDLLGWHHTALTSFGGTLNPSLAALTPSRRKIEM